MWNLSAPWWEFVLRGLIVYAALLFLMRVSGKRQIGQLSPLDLVLLLIISNAVQNAMNGGDNSVTAGLILAATLFGADVLVGYGTWRSRLLEALVEGRPEIIIHQGEIFQDVMRRERITPRELQKALRRNGCARVEDVHFAILETDGTISVIQKEKSEDGHARPAIDAMWREPGRPDADMSL